MQSSTIVFFPIADSDSSYVEPSNNALNISHLKKWYNLAFYHPPDKDWQVLRKDFPMNDYHFYRMKHAVYHYSWYEHIFGKNPH